jgi:hypothetical protein
MTNKQSNGKNLLQAYKNDVLNGSGVLAFCFFISSQTERRSSIDKEREKGKKLTRQEIINV